MHTPKKNNAGEARSKICLMKLKIKFKKITRHPYKKTEGAENTESDVELLPTLYDCQNHQKQELAQVWSVNTRISSRRQKCLSSSLTKTMPFPLVK